LNRALASPLPAHQIKERARALGFNLVGLTPASPSPHLLAYFRWLDQGQQGEMGYMARADRVARRRDLGAILPGARSLVIVGLDYHIMPLPAEALNDPSRGRIAAYAWGADYHQLMLPRLQELARWLRAESGGEAASRAYVDTGAILERSHAQQASLGFTGKNTMLINPRRGSDFFLGELITDAAFDNYDQPQREGLCGSCRRCLAACPTNAFPEPYVLDARRCISYLTIEHGGWIDRGLRPLMGNWVFGCDVCQVVCPWQRFAVTSQETGFFPLSVDRAAPPLRELLALTPAGFHALFGGSAVERAGRDQVVRNACVAAANGWQADCVPLLIALLDDASAIVRGHAAWALGRLGDGAGELMTRLAREGDEIVREELQNATASLRPSGLGDERPLPLP
jgi:epoxyqueuosine reductase